MLCQISIVGGGCDVHGIVDFLNEDLHRLIHIVIDAHPLVIVLKIPIPIFRINKVKVRHNIFCGDIGVSNVFFPKGSNVGFVNGGDKKRLEGLVCHVVLGIRVEPTSYFRQSSAIYATVKP